MRGYMLHIFILMALHLFSSVFFFPNDKPRLDANQCYFTFLSQIAGFPGRFLDFFVSHALLRGPAPFFSLQERRDAILSSVRGSRLWKFSALDCYFFFPDHKLSNLENCEEIASASLFSCTHRGPTFLYSRCNNFATHNVVLSFSLSLGVIAFPDFPKGCGEDMGFHTSVNDSLLLCRRVSPQVWSASVPSDTLAGHRPFGLSGAKPHLTISPFSWFHILGLRDCLKKVWAFSCLPAFNLALFPTKSFPEPGSNKGPETGLYFSELV